MTRPGGNAARDREIWLRRRRDALSYAALAGLWPLSRTRLEQIVAREDRRASVAFGDWRRAHPEKHGPAG